MGLFSPFCLYCLVSTIYEYGINIMALLSFAEKVYDEKTALVDENARLTYKELLSQSKKIL